MLLLLEIYHCSYSCVNIIWCRRAFLSRIYIFSFLLLYNHSIILTNCTDFDLMHKTQSICNSIVCHPNMIWYWDSMAQFHEHPNMWICIHVHYSFLPELKLKPIQYEGLQYRHPNTALHFKGLDSTYYSYWKHIIFAAQLCRFYFRDT